MITTKKMRDLWRLDLYKKTPYRLNPCPFCKGAAEFIYLRRKRSRIFGVYRPVCVRCKSCLASTRPTYSAEFASLMWNRRAG